MALNLIIFGPPGAGKGTQAERFVRAKGIARISTGEILREAVQQGVEIGHQAKAAMDRGELVGDDVIIGIVRERLGRADTTPGFILDGFPRTVAQATALDQMMTGRDPLVIVEIAVADTELVRRLAMRLLCDGCGSTPGPDTSTEKCWRCGGRLVRRTDDNMDTVVERLKVYHRQTEPLIEYYRRRPTFRSVNGAQAADSVLNDLTSAVESAGRDRVVGKGAR